MSVITGISPGLRYDAYGQLAAMYPSGGTGVSWSCTGPGETWCTPVNPYEGATHAAGNDILNFFIGFGKAGVDWGAGLGNCALPGPLQAQCAEGLIKSTVGVGADVLNRHEHAVSDWFVEASHFAGMMGGAGTPQERGEGAFGVFIFIETTGLTFKLPGALGGVGAEEVGAGVVPILEIDAARMPTIARNVQLAQDAGLPSLLNRETNPAVIQTNRNAACAGFCGPGSPDEYPFASTMQGGAGAQVAGVPVTEQYIQGGVLAQFYARNAIGQGDLFVVVVRWLEDR